MNERIRELYQQAHSIRYHDGDPMRDGNPPTVYWQDEKSAEKFAELIVRECLAHGKLTQSQAVVNGSEEYNAGREMGIEVFMNQIKKHFGVDE